MKLTITGAIALLLLASSVVAGEPTRLPTVESLDRQMDSLRSENEVLRRRLDAIENMGLGCGTCAPCGGCASWYGQYELTVLRPFLGNAEGFGNGFGKGYGFGHRFILGYGNEAGIGIRGRYAFYDRDHKILSPLTIVDALALDTDVADLEMTMGAGVGDWNMTLAGGVRYAHLSIGVPNRSQRFFLEGFGPTVAIEAKRNVLQNGLYAIGNFRASFIMGTMYNEDLVLPFAPPQWDDESMVILENQLGIGWKRGSFDARAVWETQFWLNDTIADDFPGIGTNITFSGLALRAGWTY